MRGVPLTSKTKFLNRVRRLVFQYPFVEKALRTVTQGRHSEDLICRLVPNHYQYPPGTLRRAGGAEFDLSEWMEWFLYFRFSDDSMDNLVRLTSPGDTVVDVGANIGSTMIPLAEKVGHRGRVIGFEPDPQRFAKCRRFLDARSLKNTELHCLGLASAAGPSRLRVRDPANQGMNQIVPQGITAVDAVPIEVTALDDFFEDHRPERVDVVKIDVEGYELEVLKGAMATIDRYRPRLFIEIDDKNLIEHDTSPREIINLIEGENYRVFRDQQKRPLGDQNLVGQHFDLVAIPAEDQ